MSNLYNNEYIRTVNEKTLRDCVEGRIHVDFNNFNNRKESVVLQHYIIKYIEKYGKTQNVNFFLKNFYTAFGNHPELYVNSPLIHDGFIDRYMPENMRNKIKEFRGKYFDENAVMQLYEKSKKYDLSDKEKSRLYSYLILLTRNKSGKYDKMLEDCTKRILNSNKLASELNPTELEFYCTYIGKMAWGERKEKRPEIFVMSNDPNSAGYENMGIICINKDTTYTPELHRMAQTVCHETQHRVQEIETMKYETRASFEMSRHQLFNKYLKSNDYDVYHLNYNYSDIELDADKTGYFKAGVYLGMLDRTDLRDQLREVRVERFDKRQYYEYMITKERKRVPADAFVVEYLNQIIVAHPEELKNYKVLNNIYEPNGQLKPFETILKERVNQTFETRGIYDNYVNYGILRDGLNKLQPEKSSIEEQRKLFDTLGTIYRDSAIKFREYCEDKDYMQINSEQISKTTQYQLSMLNKIAQYIDKNMNLVLKTKETPRLEGSSYILAKFIYDFRDFDSSKITNEVIKNDPTIQVEYNKLKNRVDSIIKKFNKEYVKDRLKDMPIEHQKANIKTLEGVPMVFDDYIYDDLLPRMDGHMAVEYKGKKINVSNIIDVYKKGISNMQEKGVEK